MTDIVSIRAARTPERVEDHPFDSSLPYVNIQALESKVPNQFTEQSNFIVGVNDLVIVKDGYRSGKVFTAIDGIAASTMAILSPRSDEVIKDYLYCYLTYCYDNFQNRLRGAAVAHLDMSYLRELSIPLPNEMIQKEIAEKYLRIESMLNEMKNKASRLSELSLKLGNKELKSKCESLNQQMEMTKKAWLNQVFSRAE